MTSRLYRDEAIVLRTYKLGEADRIIVLLTRPPRAGARCGQGVRRTSSRFGARLEPFSMIDVQLHVGRNLDVVTQAEIIDPFGRGVSADYAMFTCASTMVETAERLSADDGDLGTEASPQQYLLLAGALAAMSHRRHAPGLILDSYLLRALALGGWAPSCYDCALCGAPGPHRAFHVQAGGAVCESCRSAAPSRSSRPRWRSWVPCSPATGPWPTPPVSASAPRPPDSSRPTRPGTWSGACAPSHWWKGHDHDRRLDRHGAGHDPGHDDQRGPAPAPPGLTPPSLPSASLPQHVAVVMDGNGRWANARGLPRTEGHRVGESNLLDVVAGAVEIGVSELSAYAFSTENWRRSPGEVRFIMGFARKVLRAQRDILHSWNVKVRWVGRTPRLWRSVLRELREAERLTAHNTGLVLNLCINYGGRAEIADATRAIAEDVAAAGSRPPPSTRRSSSATCTHPL